MQSTLKIDKLLIDIINQLFEIEKKASEIQENNSIQRNVNKLKDIILNNFIDLNGAELMYFNPIGESFVDTRTDCEASIAGTSIENLVITEVIKPIIRYQKGDFNMIVQKAIVVVESKK